MKKVIALISILILSSCAKYSEIQSYSFAQVSGIAEILKRGCKVLACAFLVAKPS